MGLDNPLHIAFLLIVLLLVFGAKRLPDVGRSLGSGLRGFKDSLSADNVNQTAPTQPQLAAASPALEAAQAAVQAAPPAQTLPPNSEEVARSLFSTYLLPFEIASLLLLVAMIGAVVMAKKRA